MGFALSLVLSACGSSASPSGVASQSASASASASKAPAATKLTVAIEAQISILDPDGTASDDSVSAILNIFDALLDRDPTNGDILPRLATSWQWLDDTHFQVKLRQGVKFSNGEPLTADDVKFTFDRTLDPATKSLSASQFSLLQEVRVVDDYTVEFVLSAPDVVFPQRLIERAILPKDYVTSNTNWADHPIGSGPYVLADWQKGSELTLKRNESYWGTPPAYDTVVIRTVPEAATRLADLLSGGVDIAANLTPDQIDLVNASSDNHATTVPKILQAVIQLDGAGRTDPNGPFTDVRVRQAVNYGVDFDSIIKNILHGAGTRIAAGVNPLQWGYDPSIQPYPYDPAKARQLLAEAGYPDGFTARLISQPANIPAQAQTAEQVAADLAKIGIKVQIQEVPDPAEVGKIVRDGQAGPMIQFGNGSGGQFDAAAALAYIYRCGNPFSYYCNQDFESLYTQQASTTDPAARKKLLSQMQQILHDDAAHLFEWAVHGVWGVSNAVNWPGYSDRNDRWYTAKPAS